MNPIEVNRWPHDDRGSDAGRPGEPDETSSEGSEEDLRRIDQQLLEAGQISEASERAKDPDEILAEALSEALGNLGLYNADEIDASMLQELPEPVLEKLTPLTAESLYFETYRRSRKWLGNEPVTPRRVFSLAKAWGEIGADPEKVYKQFEADSIRRLKWAGIDPDQILDLLTGDTVQVATINRLHFLLFAEPSLKKFTRSLHDQASQESPWDIKEVVEKAQARINERLEELDYDKDKDSNPKTSTAGWDSVAEDLHNRITHRLLTNRGISIMILRALELKDDSPFLDDDSFFVE